MKVMLEFDSYKDLSDTRQAVMYARSTLRTEMPNLCDHWRKENQDAIDLIEKMLDQMYDCEKHIYEGETK